MTPFSIFIIAFNEQERLRATLTALQGLTDDLVVVDSGSTDGTQELAHAFGARVIYHPWSGYGEQKRFAETCCRHNWIFTVDADEVATPQLVQSIRSILSQKVIPCDGYKVSILKYFPGEKRLGAFAHRNTYVRLYRKDKGRYSASPVHDVVIFQSKPRIGRLKGHLDHYSIISLGQELKKLNRYADMFVDDRFTRGISLSPLRLWLEFPLAFLKAYIIRRYMLRGRYGFMASMNYAFYRHLRIAKYVERQILRSSSEEPLELSDRSLLKEITHLKQ
jgi:glycosyltransferase involved in cell wall biosynthesis